jgi:plasmid stabilization system protein ParE
MSLPIALTPDARDDIDDARAWYEVQQTGRGDAFLDEVRDQLTVIEQNPHQYGLVSRKVRAAPLPASKYIIYYRIETNQVVVTAVMHASANPRNWQRRK